MNIIEMADEERRMIVDAEKTYGVYFTHAAESVLIYSVVAREATAPD